MPEIIPFIAVRFGAALLIASSLFPFAANAAPGMVQLPLLPPPPSIAGVPPVPMLDTLPVRVNIVRPSPWKTYTENGYSFTIPRLWKTEAGMLDGQSVTFFKNANGTRVAWLVCPPVTTGYEGYTSYKTYKREVKHDGSMYDVSLNLGTPEKGTGLPPLAFISMTKRGFVSPTEDFYTDPGYGCELHAFNASGLQDLFKTIYRSVKATN